MSSDALEAFWTSGAPLRQAMPGYQIRPSQVEMSRWVQDALEDGQTRVIEAGTGIGKTFAYLAPVLLGSRRVIISTATLALQDQLMDRDIPTLQDALGVRREVALLKGRGRYLCRYRFLQSEQDLWFSDRASLGRIRPWMEQTRSGDLSECATLSDAPDLIARITSSGDNCLGQECPEVRSCHVLKARRAAMDAEVVVVNHHLLFADMALREDGFGELLPGADAIVVDEAHQLEDVATQYFGVAVSNYRVDELVRDGLRVLGAKSIAEREKAADLRQALTQVEAAARELFTSLQFRRPGTSTRAREGGGLFDERLRLTEGVLEVVGESGLLLTEALGRVEAVIAGLKEPGEDVRGLARRAGELREHARFLLRATDPGFVFFLEIRGRGVFLRATPIDVAALVREHLLERPRTVVLTSATLAVNGSFEYVRGRLGITAAEEIRLPSEFGHATQSLLYLPRKMPDPRSPEFVAEAAREVVEILGHSEGRAFVLFTSYANLREVHARIAPLLPYPLLVQGEAPRTQLIDRFRRTPNAVLLATSSFWQGVDVVGEALSCVIIDKLPFASPGDPIVQARIEAINEAGGDAFRDYQVPLAILTLLQGLGRLLRHRTDRGVLAILDPRLRSMGYGRRFLDSLPPAPITHRIEDVARFFAPA